MWQYRDLECWDFIKISIVFLVPNYVCPFVTNQSYMKVTLYFLQIYMLYQDISQYNKISIASKTKLERQLKNMLIDCILSIIL